MNTEREFKDFYDFEKKYRENDFNFIKKNLGKEKLYKPDDLDKRIDPTLLLGLFNYLKENSQPGSDSDAALQARNTYLEQEVTRLQRDLDSASGEVARLKRQNQVLRTEVDQSTQQVSHWKLEAERARQSQDASLDPKGYYKALGIDPVLARTLSEERLDELLQGIYRVYAKINHPDRGGDTERMKKVNSARDFFADPLNRRSYGR